MCDVISCSVWSSDTYKINVYDKIMTDKQKKYVDKINFYINIHIEDRLETEFTAC